MSLFLHLVRRELRDVRWLVRGGLLAVAVLIAGSYWWVDRIGEGTTFDLDGDLARFWIAAAAVLGGGAVAAEVFAGDTSSRRVEGAALLPTGLRAVYAAKAGATLLVAVLSGAWAAGWAPAAAALLAPRETAVGAVGALADAPAILLVAPFVVGAVALFAILFEHGIGSVVSGVAASVGTVVAAGVLAPWRDWGFSPPMLRGFAIVALALAAVVLWLCAGLAFVHGPIHLARRVRRAALGLGGALAVFVPCGWAAAAVLESRTEIVPGDPGAQIWNVLASPDGRHAVLMVGAGRVPAISRAWLVDLSSGTTVVLPGKHRTFHGWGGDGTVRLWGASEAQRVSTIEVFDVATGRLLRSRSQEQFDAEPHAEHWARIARSTDGWLVEWPARGIRRHVARATMLSVSPRDGAFLAHGDGKGWHVVDLAAGVETQLPDVRFGRQTWRDGGRILRVWATAGAREFDVETRTVRDLAPPTGAWGNWGAGPYAVSHPDPKRSQIVDTRDGRVVAGPWTHGVWFVHGSESWAITYDAEGRQMLLDCATGREVRIDAYANAYGSNVVAALPGERFAVARRGAGLAIVDASGVATPMPLRAE